VIVLNAKCALVMEIALLIVIFTVFSMELVVKRVWMNVEMDARIKLDANYSLINFAVDMNT
jgi:hypothetical protein